MNRILQNIRTWPVNHDLMTDAFYIEEDRTSAGSGISERGANILIVSAALAVWAGAVMILWP